ncbi:MAG: hypothetical protein AB9856_17530 [Cellulosilyticaceae bacterium]
MDRTDYQNQLLPKIGVQKYTNTREVRIGGTIKYTVHISNLSPITIRNLIFHDETSDCLDILPESIYINKSAIHTTCMKDLFLGDLDKGGEMLIEFEGRIKSVPQSKYIATKSSVEYNYYNDSHYIKSNEKSNDVCVQLISSWVD